MEFPCLDFFLCFVLLSQTINYFLVDLGKGSFFLFHQLRLLFGWCLFNLLIKRKVIDHLEIKIKMKIKILIECLFWKFS